MAARLTVFRAFNLAVTLAALIFIMWASAEAQKYFEHDVLCVMPAVNDNTYYFSPKDMEVITESGFEGITATEYMKNTVAAAGEMKAFSGVVTTGRDYFSIYRMSFIDGGPWTPAQENERVIILSESLAWMLFGDTKSAGLTVYLNNEAYTVTGVAAQGTVGKSGGFAWIPPYEGEEVYSSVLYIKPVNYNILDSYLDAVSILEAMNRSIRDYIITDLNTYAHSISLRGQVLMFLLGIYIICLMLLYLIRLGRNTRKAKTGWMPFIIFVPLVAAVTALIISFTAFDLWVPAFAGDGLAGFSQALLNAGLLAPRPYLSYNLSMLHSLNLYANIAFGAGLLGLAQFAIVK